MTSQKVMQHYYYTPVQELQPIDSKTKFKDVTDEWEFDRFQVFCW